MNRKILNIQLILAALLLTIAGCSSTEKNEKSALASASDVAKCSLKIDGMTCQIGCATYIQKKLAAENGVSDCKVDFESKTAHLIFDPSITSQDDCINKIQTYNNGAYKVTEAKSIPVDEKVEAESDSENNAVDLESKLGQTQGAIFPNLLNGLFSLD